MKLKTIIFLLLLITGIVVYIVWQRNKPKIRIISVDYDARRVKAEFSVKGQKWSVDYTASQPGLRGGSANEYQSIAGLQAGIWTDPNAYGGEMTALAIAPDGSFDVSTHRVRKEIFWLQKKVKDIPRW
jgi:hypothetical protein